MSVLRGAAHRVLHCVGGGGGAVYQVSGHFRVKVYRGTCPRCYRKVFLELQRQPRVPELGVAYLPNSIAGPPVVIR